MAKTPTKTPADFENSRENNLKYFERLSSELQEVLVFDHYCGESFGEHNASAYSENILIEAYQFVHGKKGDKWSVETIDDSVLERARLVSSVTLEKDSLLRVISSNYMKAKRLVEEPSLPSARIKKNNNNERSL